MLLADHENRERTRYRWTLAPAASGRRRLRCRPTLLAHRQDVIRLTIERDCSGAVHRLKVLFDLETRGLFSLIMVNVPLPCVLKASIVEGLNTAPSDPPASGRLAMILPSAAVRITIMGCAGWAGGFPEFAHAAKST